MPSISRLQHASGDKPVQAFPPLFILQAPNAGRGGLGMRVAQTTIIREMHFCAQVISELYIMIEFAEDAL